MALGRLDSGKLLNGLGDDAKALLELLLGDDQRRGEADDVAMGGFGQKTLALEKLIDDNGIEETLSSNGLEDRGVESLEAIAEHVAQLLSLGSEVLLLHDLQSADGDGAAQGVSAVGRAVSTRLDDHHDLLAAEDAAHGVHTARDGLSKSDKVGLDVGPLGAEHASSSADASLDLVADEQNVVLGAESLNLGEIILVGDNDTGLTLNGLADESGSLLLGNALDLVCPLAGNLDGSLDGLCTSAHWQNHVVAKDAADLLSPLGKDIVVEGSGAESQPAGLLSKSLDELGVTMALIDSAVGGEEVVVVAALRVPDVDALGAGEDNGERVIVVSGVLLLNGNGLVG
ncbi:hypothetical protein HG530_013975 [Fusarium avenaceum]|nr:hypothetical protein HG530_013975 [Fusarium avenaceum]